MSAQGVSVHEAALALGVSSATVRRDVARGAPCVRRGSVGRGRGTLLELDAYRRWRDREPDNGDTMRLVTIALVDVLKRDGGLGEPAHVSLGIGRREAAALLCIVYERIHRGVTGCDAETLPPEIAHAVSNLARWRP